MGFVHERTSYTGRDYGMIAFRRRFKGILEPTSREEVRKTWPSSPRLRKEKVKSRKVMFRERDNSLDRRGTSTSSSANFFTITVTTVLNVQRRRKGKGRHKN
jgi:hypothetical protein